MSNLENTPTADHVFDGGSMDCGSGLILLIRQNMLKVPPGGVLEIRSREPTVESELPPWCRMVGHEYLQSIQNGKETWQHWVRRRTETDTEQAELEADRKKAQQFQWNLRARAADGDTTVYSRNFFWKAGSTVDFNRVGNSVSTLEHFFGALLSDVIYCFSVDCTQNGILLDELEGTVNGILNNSLAATGVEVGDPSVKQIKLVVYVTSPAATSDVQNAWEQALTRSPIFQTLQKSCEIDSRMVLL